MEPEKIQVLFLYCKSQVSLLINNMYKVFFFKSYEIRRGFLFKLYVRGWTCIYFSTMERNSLYHVYVERPVKKIAKSMEPTPPPPPGQRGIGYESVKFYGDWYKRISESLSWYFSANFCALLLCDFLCFLFLFNRSSCSNSPSLSDLSHLSQNCEFFKLFHISLLIQMNTKRTVEEVRNKTVFSAMKGCNVGLWFSGPTCSGNTLSGNVVEFSIQFMKPWGTI